MLCLPGRLICGLGPCTATGRVPGHPLKQRHRVRCSADGHALISDIESGFRSMLRLPARAYSPKRGLSWPGF